jgi:hypothetical protein
VDHELAESVDFLRQHYADDPRMLAVIEQKLREIAIVPERVDDLPE